MMLNPRPLHSASIDPVGLAQYLLILEDQS